MAPRNSFNRHYLPLLEIKDFNVLIDNKLLFDQSIKNRQGAYEKLVAMSRNNDYTTGNLLDFLYHQKYYKHNGIDLSRQINTSIFFNYYLAAPRPTLGYSQGGSLTNLMLITAFYPFRPEAQQEPRNEANEAYSLSN